MKLKDLFCVTTNKKTHQESWHLRLKELKKKGLTTKQLLNIDWPVPTKPVSPLK